MSQGLRGSVRRSPLAWVGGVSALLAIALPWFWHENPRFVFLGYEFGPPAVGLIGPALGGLLVVAFGRPRFAIPFWTAALVAAGLVLVLSKSVFLWAWEWNSSVAELIVVCDVPPLNLGFYLYTVGSAIALAGCALPRSQAIGAAPPPSAPA